MRGFAQTAYCPRCETAHATGVEVAPIITCTKCGLGFDPTREPIERVDKDKAPEAVNVVPPEIRGLLGGITAIETIGDGEAMLRIHETTDLGSLLFAIVCGVLGFWVMPDEGLVIFAPFAIAGCVLGGYAWLSRTLGDIVIYVSADTLSSKQRPLPRRRARVIHGDVWSLSIVPRKEWPGDRMVVYATEAGGERRAIEIASVEYDPNHVVRWIRTQRARVGAPVLEPD